MSVLYLAFVFNVCFCQLVIGQGLPRLPCPDIFRYESYNEPGYYPFKGVIQIKSQLPVNLTVDMIIPAILRSTYRGRFVYNDNKKELQRASDMETEPTFRFYLIYPDNLPIPQITLIRLNNLNLCSYRFPRKIGTKVTYTYTMKQIPAPNPSGGRKRVLYQWNFHADYKQYNGRSEHGQSLLGSPAPEYGTSPQIENSTYHQLDDNPLEVILEGTKDDLRQSAAVKFRPDSIPFNVNPMRDACGKPITVNPLVVGGEQTGRGQWPWLVALYESKGTRLEFNCGATLVSDQLLLTAAHCVSQNFSSTKRGMKAYIGKYDLSNWDEPGAQLHDIRDIYVHPEYQTEADFRCDIAVLKLRKAVTMSQFVVPACLWFEDVDERFDFGDSEGIVVGWGRESPEGTISPVPRMINLPIVSKEECLESSNDLRFLARSGTFCAGKRNGDGPCSGDSGSGLLTTKVDINGNLRWFLRGIVSLTLKKVSDKSYTCDLYNYVVFTDVLKFRDWLSRYIPVGL